MQDNLQVTMDEFLPLRDVVFNTLRQAILTGELKPGERLMEIHLANKLGVSRTPIREAIRKLELEGLVTMIPRRGAEVAQITEKSMNDVLEVRKILEEEGRPDIRIIAKIESGDGVRNIDSILHVADGIMVARGDMGVEIPFEEIPQIQKMLIKKGYNANKQVITATQMLESMIKNPRPTRAEATDIANAIYYRTDALMLSGETAYGKYPVDAVKTMTKIAAQAEKDKLEENDIRIPLDENSNDVTAFLAKQAVKATSKLKIRAIITDSYSGRTARNLAAFRGKYPVLAICYKEKTMRHLALSYGVEAIYMPELANGQEYYFAALRRLLKEGRLQPTDMVGYLSSGKEGTQTSFLEINVVEDALKHAEDTVLPNNNRYL